MFKNKIINGEKMEKKVLSGLRLDEIESITEELKASKFRAKQIHNWISVSYTHLTLPTKA